MPRKTKIKQYGQGGRTRGRHKHRHSKETRVWHLLVRRRSPLTAEEVTEDA